MVRSSFPFLLLLSITLFAFPAVADLGPKPTMEFSLSYSGQPIQDNSFSAALLDCSFTIENERLILEAFPNGTLPELDYLMMKELCRTIAPDHDMDEFTCYGILSKYHSFNSDCNRSIEGAGGLEFCELDVFDAARGCYWRKSLFSWGGKCLENGCTFGYHLPDRFRLAVYLPSEDRIFISQETVRNNFYSTYLGNLHDDGTITIEESTTFWVSDLWRNLKVFLISFILTLILESLVVLAYCRLRKIDRRVFLTSVIGNLISLPVVWAFVFILDSLFMGEVFAFTFEAMFIYFLNRKLISFRSSAILSVLMNAVSLIIGGIILFIVAIMGITI